MSLELLGAEETENGMSVTFATDSGLEALEGTCDEFAYLATVMQQVGALAALNDHEKVWIEDVPVGDATVRLGLNPGRQARVRIVRG